MINQNHGYFAPAVAAGNHAVLVAIDSKGGTPPSGSEQQFVDFR